MTDPVGATSARRTRRQLLTGGTGALAAVLTAEALARPAPAQAANGDPLILGQANDATHNTILNNTTPGNFGLVLHCLVDGIGLEAEADTGVAVLGVSNSGAGVAGFTGSGASCPPTRPPASTGKAAAPARA
jgi:hypothetical protein